MWTFHALVSGRIATVALLAVFVSSPASAEICVDLDLQLAEREQLPALVESMAGEAASIWEPYGVWLRWPAAPSHERCGLTQASFTVLFDHHPRRTGSGATVLGSTRLMRHATERVPIQIDHKAIETVLGSLGPGQLAALLGRSRVEPADVGRALGRVLAHEVGHVLLAVRDHQPRGLMRKAFGAEDLLAPERDAFGLLPAEVARLRQRAQTLNAFMK